MIGYFLKLDKQNIIVGMSKIELSLSEISIQVGKSKKNISLNLQRYPKMSLLQIVDVKMPTKVVGS